MWGELALARLPANGVAMTALEGAVGRSFGVLVRTREDYAPSARNIGITTPVAERGPLRL